MKSWRSIILWPL